MHMQRRWITTLVVLGGLAGFGIGCATNPVTGRRELTLVSEAQLQSIGREGYGAVASEYGLYGDARVTAFVDSVGKKVAGASHLPQGPWTITVLDDPVVNAFAMPGGYVYVTRGILAHLNSEAQLAGVLGHEVGHVTARHSASRITQQQLAGLGLGIASIVSETVREYSQAAQTALGLLFLKYGRDDENQADALGVQYSTASAFDPREIPSTYAMLRRVGERSGQRLPAFLSTHPDPGDREVRTTELAKQAAAGKTGLRIEGRSYLARLEGMPFGNDPRNGYFEGATYFHPAFAVQLAFPAGWKTQDTRASVAAQEPNERGVMQLKLAADASLSPAAYVQKLQTDGKIAGAQGRAETIGGWPAWVGTIAVPQQDGTSVPLMFEFLGRSAAVGDAEDSAIRAAIRSLRPLTDSGRLAATPDRLALVRASRTGTFAEVFPTLGATALDVENTAVLNNLDLEETVRSGQTIKVVRPGRRK
jgi:predicted Zn-dependent protease